MGLLEKVKEVSEKVNVQLLGWYGSDNVQFLFLKKYLQWIAIINDGLCLQIIFYFLVLAANCWHTEQAAPL